MAWASMLDVADSTADWSVAVTSGLGAILKTEDIALFLYILGHEKVAQNLVVLRVRVG